MKDVVLITNYWHFPWEKDSSRYFTLATMLADAGVSLEVVTSDFYHATKSHRDETVMTRAMDRFQVTLLHEPGYEKNISFRRLASHREFARSVEAYLAERKRPDLLYCVIPSLDVADVVSQHASRKDIPFILDIQDLWPEAFRLALDIPLVTRWMARPFRRMAERAYSAADHIIAVSQTYVDRALEVNARAEGTSVYLGVDLDRFDGYARERPRRGPNSEFRIGYAGALGHSYDLETVISSMRVLRERGLEGLRLVVMGDGPRAEQLKRFATTSGVDCEFTGQLPYDEMVKMLCNCDIAVNPIMGKAAASIINKHADYFASGIAVVNTQDSGEYRSLLTDNDAGLNAKNQDVTDVADKIQILYEDEAMRNRMGRNGRRVAERLFDRKRSYAAIVEVVHNLAER